MSIKPAQDNDSQQEMSPKPQSEMKNYQGSNKLKDKVAIVTGGDSGIGRAVAIGYAKEGADVAIVYLEQEQDAEETKKLVEKENRKCLVLKGDIGDEIFCKEV